AIKSTIPRDTNGSVQTTTTGGAKPLHRFIKGQPKIVGVNSSFIAPKQPINFLDTCVILNVTISLALSIVTLLGTLWTILHILPDLAHMQYVRHYEYMEENVTESDYFTSSLEVILLIKFLMGGIIFVVMSTLGGIALRSTNSQVKYTLVFLLSHNRIMIGMHQYRFFVPVLLLILQL
uniref:Uncharacterized protein n=1 Tax=Periophthalmus magnuspinnatus TaxID=409849 RepID=A0A3B3ZS22_9GOBI